MKTILLSSLMITFATAQKTKTNINNNTLIIVFESQ